MQRVLGYLVLLQLLGGAAYPALAVEPAQPFIRLWMLGTGNQASQSENFLSLDLIPGTAGLELPGVAQTPKRSARDTSHKINLTITTRLEARNINGGALLFTPSPLPSLVSGKYPDPTDPQFQCGGVHQTQYNGNPDDGGGQCPCQSTNPTPGCFDPTSNDFFPGTFNIGMGVGNVGSTRVLVFGDAITGSYFNNVDGDVDISTYMVTVYSLTINKQTIAKLWTRSFAGNSSGFRLEPVLSGVAAFHTKGKDELRIAYIKDNSNNSKAFQYLFFDLLTGNPIGNPVNFTTSAP